MELGSFAHPEVAIFGAGVAGLMAAQAASTQGCRVIVFEGGPAPGRKFLVAGRGGLNLSNMAPFEEFLGNFCGGTPGMWRAVLAGFDTAAVRAWCESLGSSTFAGTSRRVFPTEKTAARLLRSWITNLRGKGVEFRFHHVWRGFQAGGHLVETPEGLLEVRAGASVMAFGGASWPETGSTGAWVESFRQAGIRVAAFEPSNCGWEIAWPPAFLAQAEGRPLKNVAVSAGGCRVEGECLITRYGIEGGAVYRLGRILRSLPKPRIEIDLKPSLTVEAVCERLAGLKTGEPVSAVLAQRLKLSPAGVALVEHFTRWRDARELAVALKSVFLDLKGPRPIAEAISSAGGVLWEEVDANLMLVQKPGVFVAGEMLDWDAPTGGFLIHGCLALGRLAGLTAAKTLTP